MAEPLRVTVLGAGVVGLSTAISFLSRSTPSNPIAVRIVALSTPDNPNADPHYASPKAAANWRSFADDDDLRQQTFDGDTFKVLWQLACLQDRNPGVKTYVRRLWSYEAYPEKTDEPWFKDFSPNYSAIDPGKLPPSKTFGYQYETVAFDVDGYLGFLMRTFVRLGGEILGGVKVKHLDELINGLGWKDGVLPDIVLLACGLGALYLPGLEDKKVFPTRGQTLLVKAAAARDSWITVAPGAGFSYVIPRFNGDSHHVILGGTAQAGDL
jgi:glycine/D-amino acid oxidase-like deaminating enzyme